ncbi:MAG: alpha-1,2-fucosyltransferase [Plesiomonas shigelloides]
MIQVKLLGGLGNQLFQLAYAIDISNQTGENITLNISAYKKYKIRQFSLERFKISKKCNLTDDETLLSKFGMLTYRVYQKVMKVINITDFYGKWPFYLLSKIGCYYNFDQKYYQLNHRNRDKVIYGYFQSEKYFLKSKRLVLDAFQIESDFSEREIFYRDLILKTDSNILAVSMRLGDDYHNCQELNVCDAAYYKEAIGCFFDKYKKLSIFVFSDEIERAKSILSIYDDVEITYVTGLSDYQSLRLMSVFDKFVIPNSSFSWWGAYLSERKGKQIICPDKWFNNVSDDSDIYTSDMIKLRDYER